VKKNHKSNEHNQPTTTSKENARSQQKKFKKSATSVLVASVH
jgi:hypothetical protein